MVSAAMNLTDVALTATSPGMTARQVLRRPVWPVFVFAPDVPFAVRPVWGVCNHAFHMHCIMKWLQAQSANQHCPMCRRAWEFRAT